MKNDLRWNNDNSWTDEVSPIIGKEVRYLSKELFNEYIILDEQSRQTFYESLACVPAFVFEWHRVQYALDALEDTEAKVYVEYKKIIHADAVKRAYCCVSDFCVSDKSELSYKQIASLYRATKLFMHLSYLLERVQNAIDKSFPPMMIEMQQEKLAQYYQEINNFRPTQEEINLISIVYDEAEKDTNEIEKFKNAKMLWDFLLDQGLAKECIYVKGIRLPGAGFSKQ